jgi:nucleoid-associated protein YgaU
MGLFSFLKNAGAKLFNKNETKTTTNEGNNTSDTAAADALNRQKAALLKGAVEGLGLDVKGLEIELNGETVIVSGEVSSQQDREKVILSLGNVEGISAVDDRLTVNAPEPEPEAVFYEVKKGDTLSKIAKAHYGDAMKYPVIFEANRPMLKSADLIYPGQMLRIPALDA